MPRSSSRLFGIAVPIIQAPMAGVSTPELAAAVSNAGGLGSSASEPFVPAAQRMIEETRARTSAPSTSMCSAIARQARCGGRSSLAGPPHPVLRGMAARHLSS